MRVALALTLTAALVVASSSVAAQAGPDGGSILWLVPSAGTLESESEQNGTLSSSDFFGPSDIYIDVWELQGTVGGSVTIDLKSDDFDPVLFVVGPGLAETLYDDDSGGQCNSRIVLRFLESGVYRVAATTTSTRTTGVYTLSASARAPAASAVPCGGPDPEMFSALAVSGRIEAGASTVTGTLNAADPVLEDGSYVEVWEIDGEQGQTITIRLESEAFDSFLYVTGPDLGGVITDDDGGGDLHSQLVFTFPSTGTYRIIASSVESGTAGGYTLTITR
jgi:serine protease Do